MLQCARAAMRRWIGHPSTPGSSLEWGPSCVRRVMRLLAIRNGCCTGRFRSPVLAARPRPCETEKAAGKPSPARNSGLNATLQTGQPGWRNWQTQRTQNPPTARSWGFDPPSRHQDKPHKMMGNWRPTPSGLDRLSLIVLLRLVSTCLLQILAGRYVSFVQESDRAAADR